MVALCLPLCAAVFAGAGPEDEVPVTWELTDEIPAAWEPADDVPGYPEEGLLLSENAPAAGDCTCKGINLWGKVKVVNSFPDLRVQVVGGIPDLKVKVVGAFPDDCGEWQFVDAFPDFTIQFVEAFPDIKIKYVSAFPGM